MIPERFIVIPPRHRRALETLATQRQRDLFGGIGTGALRDEDDPFTLEQIVNPLMERGLIEDLSQTDLREGGKYFIRITPLGMVCLAVGYMLRTADKPTPSEVKLLQTTDRLAKYDANEEKEAIA